MPNNIAISITADVVGLTANMAIARAEMLATTKSLNDLAKAFAGKDLTAEQKAELLAAGDAAAKARSEYNRLGAELRSVSSSYTPADSAAKSFMDTLKEQVATQQMSRKELLAYKAEQLGVAEEAAPMIAALKSSEHGMVSSRAATEGLVLIHEALSGNYKRMTGSVMIMTQALAGQELATSAVNAVMSVAGAAIIGTAVAMGVATYAAIEYEHAQKELLITSVGLGAASGMTTGQLQAAGAAAAEYSGQSVRASTASAEAFAAAGIRSQAVITGLAGSVKGYAVLTGQEAADAQKALATAMNDPIKGAEDLNAQLGILDSTQIEEIRRLTEQGDKTGAVNIVTQALRERIDAASEAGVKFTSVTQNIEAHLSNMIGLLGRATAAVGELAGEMASHPMGGFDPFGDTSDKDDAAKRLQRRAQLNQDSAAGQASYAATPEGQDRARHDELVAGLVQARRALAADTELHGDHSEAVQRDRQALTDYHRALDTFLTSAEKAHKLAQDDAAIANARKNHDDAGVASATRQKAIDSRAGELASPDAVNRAADDAARDATAHTSAPKKHDDAVQQWAEQLHQQEIASKNYFADQTASELAFWQDKLKLTTAGSKDWLAVQSRIFDASKALAHQDYQDHIADLNERIQADRNNWAKEQADWQEKLAYIRSKYGEQNAEYKNASREWERAQQEHDQKELQEAQKQAQRTIDAFKKGLDAQAKVREDDARAAETTVRANASNSPYGDIQAEVQLGQIHAQLAQQKIADNEALYARETQILDASIAAAEAKYHGDLTQYQSLIDAKTKADEEYANRKAELDSQIRLQSIQDILAVQQAYHGYIDGMVNTTVSGFDQAISGQKSWAQVGISLYGSVVHSAEQQFAKMASTWLVQHLFMTAAQRAQLAIQTAQHATGETAKTLATTVGTEARVAATSTGAAQSAAITGTHNLKEITSHAATAAAAAYHAMAGIPVVGPVLGAAAAATTFAAVEAFGALASFDVGTNYVPNDMYAQIHRGERIIPAADNARLLAAVDAGTTSRTEPSNGRTPAFGSQSSSMFRDIHFHAPGNMSRSEMERHAGTLVKVLGNAYRNRAYP
ncbi:MAG: phage tail length tape measure family protein [Sphingomonadales bacterium]|nr:phage tail length tape measure family protein [Sphingomonadales bacterium]MDE2171174.1 phage tail length tape measure family protein [Sphingomonadales bacterium]